MVHNGKLDGFVAIILFVSVVGTPHNFLLIAGVVVLQQAEARLLKKYKYIYVTVHYYKVRRENI